MLGKSLLKTVRRAAILPHYVPKRNWAQVGIVICTPPRHPCSYKEKILHMFFMYFVWLSPMAYFLTQIKVWRREYIS